MNIHEPEIHFFIESITFDLPLDEDILRSWLVRISKIHGGKIDALNYIFSSDDYLLKINQDYLKHDYYTDIISFPYSEHPEPITGDIYISIDRVKDNAVENKDSFENELLRVLAHGLLHFLGFKDKNNKEREVMRNKENDMILLFNQNS